MKKTVFSLLLLSLSTTLFAQQDSIFIHGQLSEDRRSLEVVQRIIYHNKSELPKNEINLLNWVAAYKKRGTALYYRKLEDRNSDLHFAKPEELGGLKKLVITIDRGSELQIQDLTSQNLILKTAQPLLPQQKTEILLHYEIRLPISKFTGYGTDEKKVSLKYFFLVPDGFPNEMPVEKQYQDVEETSVHVTYWNIEIQTATPKFLTGNLPKTGENQFEGVLKNDPEILIADRKFSEIKTEVSGKTITTHYGYELTTEERRNLEFFLPLQLKFIEERTGLLPEKIYISEKFKKKEDFFGNDDIKFWKFRFPLFTPSENVDLDYFSIISKNVVEQSFAAYKENNHWFKNGVKSYLEIQYLSRFYKNSRLLGMLPDTKIIGIKPLKLFYASRLKLLERYGIAYQYMMTQNLDQKIDEPFSKLSNFNEMTISNFETGSLLNYVSDEMGTENFDRFLRNYISEKEDNTVNTEDFLQKLAEAGEGSSAFLQNIIERKHRANFDLQKFRRENGELKVMVKKNVEEAIPFKLETISKEGEKQEYWFETPASPSSEFYTVPDDDTHKLVVNSTGFFPESNFRDNYLYTKGLFANTKKIRFKLIKDIPNPEYNEIYINPRLNFNAYDKILLGLNFRNESLFDQKFSYSLTPYFSTGTGKMTGSGGVSYTFLPPESFYRSLTFGVSGSYFHYDYDLTYRKFSAYSNLNFTKDPRSSIGRSIGVSYNFYDKDLNPQMILENEYDRYNLWSIGYGYADNRLIHEKYFSANLQGMEDFQKISAEAFYRYEYAQNKKIAFRVFGGYFLSNKTRNNSFDYGISKISNYGFSYGLLGQSATSGVFSQQFVLADGGFKSYINGTVNQWIGAINVDSHVWKMFNLYADAGLYKNRGADAKFIWDTGVKVRVIPDFLEVYLPVYSTLGFEPSFKDYAKRIRYTLVLNLGAIVNTLRRGWY